MIRKIVLVLISVLIGFGATTIIHFYTSKQTSHMLSPLSIINFSLEKPPSASLVGVISSISGNVSWQSRTGNQPVAITQPRKIQQGEELQTDANGSLTLQFPNAAIIQASQQTHLAIIQTLPANIVIQQSQGTALYTTSSSIPLSVRSLDLLITSKTGKMIVTVDKKLSLVTVTMKDGSATAAYTDTQHTTHILTLTQKNTLTFNNKKKEATD